MAVIPAARKIPPETRVWRGVLAYPSGRIFGPVFTTRREAELWMERESARRGTATIGEPVVVSAVGRRPDVTTVPDDVGR